MDALVHAIESFVGVPASVFTDPSTCRPSAGPANLRQADANGENRAVRENMLHASCIAGMAFSNTARTASTTRWRSLSGAGTTCRWAA